MEDRERSIAESMRARFLGQEVVKFIKASDPQCLERGVNEEALALLDRIKTILDDTTIDDPKCFHRIEAVVDAFHEVGIPTRRHDW